MATQDIGEIINATNVVEGISPHWNEMIYADVTEEMNHSEGETLCWSDRDEMSLVFLQRSLY
jgi:hypothetical protein